MERKIEIKRYDGHMPAPVKKIADAIKPNLDGNTYYSVMLFRRACEIRDTNSTDYEYQGSKDTRNWNEALGMYANTPCPASQLIEAKSAAELLEKKRQMIEDFKNKKWLEENIEPYV